MLLVVNFHFLFTEARGYLKNVILAKFGLIFLEVLVLFEIGILLLLVGSS
jgi:hypothetical protein